MQTVPIKINTSFNNTTNPPIVDARYPAFRVFQHVLPSGYGFEINPKFDPQLYAQGDPNPGYGYSSKNVVFPPGFFPIIMHVYFKDNQDRYIFVTDNRGFRFDKQFVKADILVPFNTNDTNTQIDMFAWMYSNINGFDINGFTPSLTFNFIATVFDSPHEINPITTRNTHRTLRLFDKGDGSLVKLPRQFQLPVMDSPVELGYINYPIATVNLYGLSDFNLNNGQSGLAGPFYIFEQYDGWKIILQAEGAPEDIYLYSFSPMGIYGNTAGTGAPQFMLQVETIPASSWFQNKASPRSDDLYYLVIERNTEFGNEFIQLVNSSTDDPGTNDVTIVYAEAIYEI